MLLALHIETGCFWIVRNADGSVVHLFPGSELRAPAVMSCPAEERRRRAEERAAHLAMLLSTATVKNRSALAKPAPVSRARITQILALLQNTQRRSKGGAEVLP